MGDGKNSSGVETKFEPAAERGFQSDRWRIETPNVDLTSAKDSDIARAKPEAPAGTVGGLELYDLSQNKLDAARQRAAATDASTDATKSGSGNSDAKPLSRFEERDKLNTSITAAFGGDENKILAFNHQMNRFENRVCAGGVLPADKANAKIANVYNNLNQMITSDEPNAPLSNSERMDAAVKLMQKIADPASQGGAYNPEFTARAARELTTKGYVHDAFGSKWQLPAASIRKDYLENK